MYVPRVVGECDKEHLSFYGGNYGRAKGLAEGWHLSGGLDGRQETEWMKEALGIPYLANLSCVPLS